MAHAHCMLDKKGYTHTHTLSEYVILVAFPLQQSLYERPSLLRYRYSTLRVLLYLYRAVSEGRKNLRIVWTVRNFCIFVCVGCWMTRSACAHFVSLIYVIISQMARPTKVVCVCNSFVQRVFKILRIFRSGGYRRPFYRVTVQGSFIA
jgi:hypothetical protein